VRHTPGHVIDLVPTVLAATGAKSFETWKDVPAPKARGVNLMPAFAKDGTVRRDSIWWMHDGNRAIRAGDWKAVAAKNGPWELFNLSDDRCETHDLSQAKPEKLQELTALWQRQFDEYSALAAKDLPPAAKPKGK
jgi:arylsulfatase